jgi:hypothetical protein
MLYASFVAVYDSLEFRRGDAFPIPVDSPALAPARGKTGASDSLTLFASAFEKAETKTS